MAMQVAGARSLQPVRILHPRIFNALTRESVASTALYVRRDVHVRLPRGIIWYRPNRGGGEKCFPTFSISPPCSNGSLHLRRLLGVNVRQPRVNMQIV